MIHSQVEPVAGLDKITKNALIVSALGAAAGTIYALVTKDLTVPLGAGCGFVGGLIGGIARGLVMSLPRQRR
jgi:hypothetical protein